jgi:UPF0755 protein
MTRARLFVSAFVLLLVGAVLLAVMMIRTRLSEPFRGYTGTEQFVEIPTGEGARAIERRLLTGGVIRDRFTFRAGLRLKGASRQLRAGEYRFHRPMSVLEVIDVLSRGAVYERLVTFPEGLTVRETAALFEQHGLGSASAFIDASRDVSIIRDLDPQARDLEGYLFPETYAVARNAGPTRLVRMMVQRFRAAFPEEAQREAETQGRTVRQVVTLASLVEKETARADERTVVAGVYRNRLARGMGLQADPTVIYGLQLAGRYKGNITRADLAFDTPYNTYVHAGLPPGPIASPGRAAIEAALRPADVDYLYFVSRNDGSHEFARTLAEHNRNVHRYQILFFREKRRLEALEREGAAEAGPRPGSR